MVYELHIYIYIHTYIHTYIHRESYIHIHAYRYRYTYIYVYISFHSGFRWVYELHDIPQAWSEAAPLAG